MNSEGQKQITDATQDLDLPLNEDGSLSFFWIDAHEETYGNEIYIFGKVWQPQLNQYVSCTLQVQGMERTVYALPKIKGKARGTLTKEEEDKLLMNVFTELEELRKRRF
jgi:DNA polymerase alpha subunit A